MQSPPHPRALVVDADLATFDLVRTWLADDGWQVSDAAAPGERFDVALVDVPYPRECGPQRVREVAAAHPGTPVVVLSATFFGSVDCCGPCARSLGVAGVLPKPLARDALTAALQRLARR